MKTKALFFALAVLMVASTAAAQQIRYSVVSPKKQSLYKGREAVGVAGEGELLTVLEENKPWLLVQSAAGQRGWLKEENITKLAEAAPIYTKMLKRYPKSADLHVSRAMSEAAAGNKQGAINDYAKALELAPKATHLYVNRGVFFGTINRHDDAIADFNKAIKLGMRTSTIYVNRASAYMSKRDWKKAIADYNKAIELAPETPSHYYQRGVANRNNGDTEAAIADFTSVLKLEPGNSSALVARGYGFYLQKEHAKAAADFNAVIKLNPKASLAYNNRGFNRQALGDYEAALDDYEKAVELAPNYALAYQNIGWLRATCPEESIRDGRKAWEAAKKACELRKWQFATDIKALAAAYAESEDFTNAIRYQKQVISMVEGEDKKAEQELLEIYESKKPYRFEDVK